MQTGRAPATRLPTLGNPTFEANGGRTYQVGFGSGQPTAVSFGAAGWGGNWSLSTKLDLPQLSGLYRAVLARTTSERGSGAMMFGKDLEAVGDKLLAEARRSPALAGERIFGVGRDGSIEVEARPGLAEALRKNGPGIPIKLVKASEGYQQADRLD